MLGETALKRVVVDALVDFLIDDLDGAAGIRVRNCFVSGEVG